MNIEKVIEVLEQHNQWRRGDETLEMADPTELGEAIDSALFYLKTQLREEVQNNMYRVIK